MELTPNAPVLSDCLWHPWTPTRVVKEGLPVFVRGQGCFVFDADGHRYLDGRSGALNASIGYGRVEVAERVRAQMVDLMTFEIASAATLPPRNLAAAIAACLPWPLTRTFFCTSGSEATECAIKMARGYQLIRGCSGRTKIACFRGAYHGATLGALAMSESPFNQFGYAIDATTRVLCDHPGIASTAESTATAGNIEHVLQTADPSTVAALIVEPILGIGGVRLPPDGFLLQLREICDRYGMLLVFDEILTGFGRTGTMFAFEHWGVLPDVLLTSKCLTGGYVPLSAVTVREDIYETFAGDPLLGGFRHGHTNSGHAACCAGALAVLEIIQREGAVHNAELRGEQLLSGLRRMCSGVPGLLEIRGKGLLVGIEFSSDVPDAADAVARAARRRGVLVRHQDNIITLAPPLIVRADEIEMVIDTLGAALRDSLESV